MTRRGLALAVMLITLAAAGTALAQGFGASASDRVFQVTWNAATTRRGQPAIEGYVANQTGYSYRGIELAVDGTDTGGRPLPTTTFIHVDSLGVYDAPYPGGNLVTTLRSGDIVYVRATASDPFGSYDITSLDVAIDGPGAGGDLNVTLNDFVPPTSAALGSRAPLTVL